jgi:iron complex outermembrane receptor protein
LRTEVSEAEAAATRNIDDHWSAAFGVDNLDDSRYFIFRPFPQRSGLAAVRNTC